MKRTPLLLTRQLYTSPKRIRIYRASRGIKKPIEMTTTKRETQKIVNINSPPNFSRTTNHKTPYGMREYATEFYDNIKTSLSDTFSGATDKPE